MAEGGGMSYALNTLLDSLGLDEDQRQRRISCQRMLQLSKSWRYGTIERLCGILLSGSTYEATTINGLSSDVDIMYVPNDIRVIEDIQDWRGDGKTTYMMDSTDCYKAFVRLYLLSSKDPVPEYDPTSISVIHEVDTRGLLIRTNFPERITRIPVDRLAELHGPAFTLLENDKYLETDFVLALRCESFPRDALGWKTRQTPLTRTRISSDIIDEINHCYLVGVGNKASALQHLEWRLSFSHIENKLVHSWNNTQYKCYVMIKFIQKDLIKPKVPDTLCSYNFKTIIMWMNEEYPSQFFVEANLEYCLLSCLKHLAEAVETKSLPHYFVDGCNLFYPKITNDPDLARKLTATIREVISSWPYCLCDITRCSLGTMIKECLSQPGSLAGICTKVHQRRRIGGFDHELIHQNDNIVHQVRCSLRHMEMSDESPIDRIYMLFDLKQRSIQQQSDQHSKEFINIVIKDTLYNIGLDLIQQSRSMTNKNSLKSLKLGEHLLMRFRNCCGIENCLKAAADFVITRNDQRALISLERVEKQIKHFTMFSCMHGECNNHKSFGSREAVYDNKPSLDDYYKHYFIGPVYYKQSQMSHVPKGLVYEVFRTTAVSPVSDPRLYDWHSQAVIHCPVYLYYLRFLYHQRQGQDAHRQVPLDNINWAAKEISNAPRSHEETNHNIIGHCHRTVGDTWRAYKEYRKSLEKEKYNNSVMWHLAVLLRGKIRGDQ